MHTWPWLLLVITPPWLLGIIWWVEMRHRERASQ